MDSGTALLSPAGLLLLPLIALGLSGCASSDPWTRTDTAYELAYVAAAAADAYSTAQIQYSLDATEQQPLAREILGERPSTSDTWQYFATVSLSHYLISRALPEAWRRWWQVGGTAYHGYMAIDNCDQGICSRPEPPPPNFCPTCQPFKVMASPSQ